MEKIVLLVFGVQGSGKGTQSIKLSEYFGNPHISTGDIFRYEIKNETELGLKVKDLTNSGQLVSDELVENIVANRLSKSDVENGFIFDGFPRSLHQAEFLTEWLSDKEYKVYAINLEVSDKEAINRMIERGRQDDTPEAIAKRLDIYHKETKPLMEYFENYDGIDVIKVDGELSIDGVYEQIIKKLGETI